MKELSEFVFKRSKCHLTIIVKHHGVFKENCSLFCEQEIKNTFNLIETLQADYPFDIFTVKVPRLQIIVVVTYILYVHLMPSTLTLVTYTCTLIQIQSK